MKCFLTWTYLFEYQVITLVVCILCGLYIQYSIKFSEIVICTLYVFTCNDIGPTSETLEMNISCFCVWGTTFSVYYFLPYIMCLRYYVRTRSVDGMTETELQRRPCGGLSGGRTGPSMLHNWVTHPLRSTTSTTTPPSWTVFSLKYLVVITRRLPLCCDNVPSCPVKDWKCLVLHF